MILIDYVFRCRSVNYVSFVKKKEIREKELFFVLLFDFRLLQVIILLIMR